jgi:hypothetical protein
MTEGTGVTERLNDVGCELGEIVELLQTIANSDAALKGDSVHAIVTALGHVREQVHDIHDDVEQQEWAQPKPQTT